MADKSQTPCILIVEDELSIRSMLNMTLQAHGFNCLEAETVQEAEQIIGQTLPNLLLIDWMLPGKSGVEYTKCLKKNTSTRDIPIILLTAKTEEENKVLGLEAGADDYITKPFSSRELIARIRAVLRRGTLAQPDGTIQVGHLIVDTLKQMVKINGLTIKLSSMEYKLLHFFITHKNRVYARDHLLDAVWGRDSFVDQRTVDVHVRRLRKKIAIDNHDKMIQTIHGSGYLFSDE